MELITMVGVISAWVQVGETKYANVFVQVRNMDLSWRICAQKFGGLSSRVGDAYKVFHRMKESNIVGVHYLFWYCSYFVMFSCPRCILETWSSSLHRSVTNLSLNRNLLFILE